MVNRIDILLIVEDNEDSIFLTSRVVRKIIPNIAIVTQTTGEDALKYLTTVTHLPQLILLDIGLPKMDGFEFIEQMRLIKRLNPVPIIIVTGLPLDISRAHEKNVAAGYMVKPVDEYHFQEQLTTLGFVS